MAVLGEEVTVEIGSKPVDQTFDAVAVFVADQIEQSPDIPSLAIGLADDLAMLQIGNEENFSHEEFGQPLSSRFFLDSMEPCVRQFVDGGGDVLE